MFSHFFDYYKKIPDIKPAGLFTKAHFATIAILVLILLLYIKIFDKKSDKVKWRFLTILAFFLPCLEISKVLWDKSQGIFSFPGSLPLHLCGLMSIFMPLTVIFKNTWLKEFVFASGCLGGICAITYPYVNIYPPIHYLYIESMLVHSTIIYIPVLMIKFGFLMPNVKNIPKNFLVLLCLAGGALIVNILTGQNFFFLMGPATDTPLYYIYPKTGYAGYMAIFIGFVLFMWVLLYAPFVIMEKRKRKDKPKEGDTLKAG